MSTTTHTPGPWTQQHDWPLSIVPLAHRDRPAGFAVDPTRDAAEFARVIARVEGTARFTPEESEAHAALIAAAPETAAERDRLREALREIEAKASRLIGTFFSACDGRHAIGRECDYCLVSSLLANARDALEQRDPR